MTPEQEKQYDEALGPILDAIQRSNRNTDCTAIKPPIGVMPEGIWRQQRVQDLANAIKRYADDGLLLPIVAEWACEISRVINECQDTKERSGHGD